MPTKRSSRKKGIQRGIARRRVGSKALVSSEQDGQHIETRGSGILSLHQIKYLTSFGKQISQKVVACCDKFHLMGFTCAQNGDYVPLSRMAQIWHYAIFLACLAICCQRAWGTAQVILHQDLGIKSFMCISVTVVHIFTFILGLGVVMRPKETMDVLNSWPHMSDSLQWIAPDSTFHPLDNVSACFKVTSGTLAGQGIAVAVPVISLLMSDLPIFLFPTMEKLGLLPEGVLPKRAWQLIFAPLEWLVVLPFMLMGAFSPNLLYMENGALDIFSQKLRGMNVNSIKSRRRVEQMYVQLELYNRIAQVWIRHYFPPFLVSLSVGVIIAAFVSIRFTEMPMIIYVNFPYAASTLMVLIFWQSYDMISVIRASEDILGKLWQHHAPYFQGMTRAKRVELMKRSKAMRPIIFNVADSEFSLNLPVNTWDEILNQTIFLLTL